MEVKTDKGARKKVLSFQQKQLWYLSWPCTKTWLHTWWSKFNSLFWIISSFFKWKSYFLSFWHATRDKQQPSLQDPLLSFTLLPFVLSEAVAVHRWHLRVALRSVFTASLAHRPFFILINLQFSLITGEANPLCRNKTLLPALCPPRLKFIMCTLLLLRLLLNSPCCLLLCIKMICVDTGLSGHFVLSSPAFACILYFKQQKRISQ